MSRIDARPATAAHRAPAENRGGSQKRGGRMSSLVRLLSVLDLFTEEKPIWTLEETIARLNFSRSMAYRYVKELTDAGLLATVGKGRFVLGPKIIELDRQIRVCDPLLAVAQGTMRGCIGTIGSGILTLSS